MEKKKAEIYAITSLRKGVLCENLTYIAGTSRGIGALVSQKTSFPWRLKPANHLIILLNRLGVSIGTMHILSIPGCKTGKIRSTPVSILLVKGQQYILTGVETGWVKNARSASWGLLSHGRKTERVALVELPVEKCPLILREFPVQVPGGVAMFERFLDLPADPEAFAQAAPRCPVFRLESSQLQKATREIALGEDTCNHCFGLPQWNSVHKKSISWNGYGEQSYLSFSAAIGTNCSMNRSNENWRPSTGQASEGTRRSLLHSWPWRSFSKRIQACPMTRLLRQRSWIGDGSWYSIVWTPIRLLSVKTNFPLHGVGLSIALERLSAARLRDSVALARLSTALALYCSAYLAVRKSAANSVVRVQKAFPLPML